MKILCEMPDCKRINGMQGASYKAVKFAHGAESWFCKACYEWVMSGDVSHLVIPSKPADGNAGDPAKKGD